MKAMFRGEQFGADLSHVKRFYREFSVNGE